MLAEKLKRMTPSQRLVYFVKERQQVYLRKKAGRPKPWTDDPILQSCYFCNIRREQDKTTVWVKENIRDLFQVDKVAFAVLAFRWFNYIPTGKILVGSGLLSNWDSNKAKKALTGVGQIFTGAFTISPSGSTKPKLERVVDDYITPVWRNKEALAGLEACSTLADGFKILSQFPGMAGGGFMAAQVIADLRYTHLLKNRRDRTTWCCLGPGSKRGLNRFLNRPIASSLKAIHLDTVLQRVQTAVNTIANPPLHMQDVQSCLCEFDKYERVLHNQGRSKRKYNGHF